MYCTYVCKKYVLRGLTGFFVTAAPSPCGVRRMHEAAGLISIEGTLEGLHKEGEGRRGVESAVMANPNKRRAGSAVKSSPEAMEEGEAAAVAAAAAAKAARKKAKKAAKLAAKAGKKVKTEL